MTAPTLAVAVDGMEPSLLERWISTGDMPNFEAILENGVSGTAECRSLSSAKQWTTHFTGVSEQRHGVSGFLRGDENRKAGQRAPDSNELINLSDVQVRTYPELLAERGITVGLINALPIWPPLELEGGFCVSGLLTPPHAEQWIYPESLAAELNEMGYRIDVRYGDRPYGFVDDDVFEDVSLQTLREDLFDLLETRIQFTKRAIEEERAEFLYVLYKSIDVIQHCFWIHMERDDPEYGETILQSYKRIDEFVGWIHDHTDANLVLFSDHGFGPRTEDRFQSVGGPLAKLGRRLPVPSWAEQVYRTVFEDTAAELDPENPSRTTGTHSNPATYLMSGPDIRDVGERDIAFDDITPTLLTLADQPIPDIYIGDPLTEALETEPQYESVEISVTRRLDIGAEDVVSDRLHNLGYANMVDDS